MCYSCFGNGAPAMFASYNHQNLGGATLAPIYPLHPHSSPLVLCSPVPSQGPFCFGSAQMWLTRSEENVFLLWQQKSGGAPLIPPAPPDPTPLVLCSAVLSQGRFCFGDAQTRLKSHHLFSFVAWSVNLSSCSPLRAYFSAESKGHYTWTWLWRGNYLMGGPQIMWFPLFWWYSNTIKKSSSL